VSEANATLGREENDSPTLKASNRVRNSFVAFSDAIFLGFDSQGCARFTRLPWAILFVADGDKFAGKLLMKIRNPKKSAIRSRRRNGYTALFGAQFY
jgi:hypothetical protein